MLLSWLCFKFMYRSQQPGWTGTFCAVLQSFDSTKVRCCSMIYTSLPSCLIWNLKPCSFNTRRARWPPTHCGQCQQVREGTWGLLAVPAASEERRDFTWARASQGVSPQFRTLHPVLFGICSVTGCRAAPRSGRVSLTHQRGSQSLVLSSPVRELAEKWGRPALRCISVRRVGLWKRWGQDSWKTSVGFSDTFLPAHLRFVGPRFFSSDTVHKYKTSKVYKFHLHVQKISFSIFCKEFWVMY